MYSTLVYFYDQKMQVLVPENDSDIFKLRWNPVYAKNLKINKGVSNTILFQCLNQDQKPVQIGDTLIFRIIDREDSRILLTKHMTVDTVKIGRAVLTLTSADTRHLPTTYCYYSIEVVHDTDGSTIPTVQSGAILVDDQSGARGTVEILDSVFPAFRESLPLTVPDTQPAEESITTSEVQQTVVGVVTFQIFLENFTGTIQPESTIGVSNQWYLHQEFYYQNRTGPVIINVSGYYDTTRLLITKTSGEITKILYR